MNTFVVRPPCAFQRALDVAIAAVGLVLLLPVSGNSAPRWREARQGLLPEPNRGEYYAFPSGSSSEGPVASALPSSGSDPLLDGSTAMVPEESGRSLSAVLEEIATVVEEDPLGDPMADRAGAALAIPIPTDEPSQFETFGRGRSDRRFRDPTPVPEPGVSAMVAVGLTYVLARLRKRSPRTSSGDRTI